MAEALYRKYRPQIFEDVVGQEHIERTIKNAIEADKVSHAYLFCGPRGTGKTTTARLLAKALLCQRGPTPEPDGTCEDCRMIAAGEHPDVYELDAASRTGVENVREEIIGRVQFAPTRGRYKVYIIDEVHMLSPAAFNALLKTLEEPPSHVVFVLATTDPQKVPETIHSRCQRFDFRRISNEAIVSRLGAICVSEGVEFEGDALDLIAHRAEGGMRNALTSLEQLIAFGEGRVTMEVAERMLGSLAVSELGEIVRFVGTRDVASCFRWTAEYVETGADLAQFTRDFAEHVRNMYVMSLAGADVALDVSESVRRELVSELPLFGPDRLARLLGVLGDLSAELKTSTNPRLSFEIALTRMVRPDSDLTLESLAERVEALEAGYSSVAHVISAPMAGAGVGAAAGAPGVATGTTAGAEVGAGAAGSGAAGVGAAAVGAASGAASQAEWGSAQRGADGRANAGDAAYPAGISQAPSSSAAHSSAGQTPAGGSLAVQSAAQASMRSASAQPTASWEDEARFGARGATQPGVAQDVGFGASSGGAPSSVVSGVTRDAGLEAASGASAGAAGATSGASAGMAGAASGASAGAVSGTAGAISPQLAESMKNPAALQRMWQAALATLKKAKAAYGVLFLNTKASFDEAAGALIVNFPAENDFAFKAVQKPDVQDELSAALAQACGAAIPFRLMKGGQLGAASVASGAGTYAAAQSQPQMRGGAQPQSQAQDRTQLRDRTQPQPQFQPQAQLQSQSQAQPQSQPQPQAQPQLQPSPQLQPQAQGAVDAETHSSPDWLGPSPTGHNPAYDEVPVDVYDDVVPYDDYDPGMFDDPAPQQAQSAYGQVAAVEAHPDARAHAQPSHSAAQQQPQPASRPAAQSSAHASAQPSPQPTAQPSSQSAVQSGARPASQFAPQPSVQPPSPDGEPSLADLEAALAFGFGEDTCFTEVRE